jgi:hypothetical protein
MDSYNLMSDIANPISITNAALLLMHVIIADLGM